MPPIVRIFKSSIAIKLKKETFSELTTLALLHRTDAEKRGR